MGSDVSGGAVAQPPNAVPAPAPASLSAIRTRLAGWTAAHGLLVTVGAVFVLLWALAAPKLIEADTWLTLLGGREIVDHGLPRHDSLAVMTQGRTWVDQQWLAHLAFYGIAAWGGLKLLVLASIALLLAPLALAMTIARRRGASARSTALFAILPAFYFTSFIRAQILSQLLCVVLLALLAAESRRPSRRMLLAFPLLVLWANLHGAALVGAALVALLGASELVRARRGLASWPRAAALVLVPWPCLLATPYGLSVVDYYASTLGNAAFAQGLTEWMPPSFPSLSGVFFFPLAGAAIFIVARRGRELTGFELAALAATLLAGLVAVRSIAWFAYACLILVAPLAGGARDQTVTPSVARIRVLCALVAGAAALAAVTAVAVRPEERLTSRWPAEASGSVARALAEDPHARVFASYEFGDWLLYTHPELRGRVAFDGRWELLTGREMRSVLDYLWQVGEGWERPSRGYRILVLNLRTQDRLVRTYGARDGVRALFRGDRVAVYDRGRS